MPSRKFSLLLIFSIILTLGLSISLGSLLAAWTAPASAPPEGNIAAPINTGATGQAKQGGLILNTGGSANGLIVQSGNVGIGTTNPQAMLDVVGDINASGNISAAAPTASNQLATKGYVDASGGGGNCMDQYYEAWCTAHQGQKCGRSGTMDYKCVGDFCTKAGISNDLDGDGYTGATDCNDNDPTIIAASDGTCDGDADGKIDQTAYLTTPKPAAADCYDGDATKYLCLSDGTACSGNVYCASTYCIDGYCCNNACTGSTCQTCGTYSSAGAGTCGYVNNSSQDPRSQCNQGSSTSDGCKSNYCSGSDYACGPAQTSGNGGCPACQICTDSDIACEYATVGTDPGDRCPSVTCTNYIYGWSGNSCLKYAGGTAINGTCNSNGTCYTSVADSCTGAGSVSASCGSSGCKKSCVANSLATDYDTAAEVCYTDSLQHDCSSLYFCNYTGTCVLKSNGASCSSAAECAGGYCFIDNDFDGYHGWDGGKRCHSSNTYGEDCCDSDNGSHPGAYGHATTNACGSWDWDCDGAITKDDQYCEMATGCSASGSCSQCAGAPYDGCSVTGYYQECGQTFSMAVCTMAIKNPAPGCTDAYSWNYPWDPGSYQDWCRSAWGGLISCTLNPNWTTRTCSCH